MRSDDHHPKRPDLARTAESWWEYLVEQYKTGAASPDDLLILSQNTIFPQLEPDKASLRDNDSYLNIWLLFAKLQPQAQDGLEERHQIYQRMYQDRIGRKNASLYLNWLHFEAKQNHSSCMRDVLRLALKNDAEPVTRIHEFMSQSGITMSDLGEIRKSQQFVQHSAAQSAPATPSTALSVPVAQQERSHIPPRESMEGVQQYGDKRASFQSSAPVNHAHPPQSSTQPAQPAQALQTPTQQSLHASSNRSSQATGSQSQRSSAIETKLAELRTKWTQASQLLNMGVMVVRGTPYLNLGRIGNGGSSKVYKVLSAANMQIYAVKVVNLVDQDESVIRQYINEVALLKDFTSRAMEAKQRMRDNPQSPPYNHNIIELIDFEHNKEKKMLLIVLEFAEIDLHKLLKNYGGHLVNNLNLLRYYWEGMLRAVQTVHEHRIVHSDLKPPNFVVVKGQVKLIDFGIAKAISQNTTNIVRQDIIGTMNYMAPEAIGCVGSSSKALKVGRPADVWALGCILYQMVYGAPPFAHIENMLQKLQVIGNPSYKIDFPTHSHNIPVPEQLIEVMMSCLQRESKERPTIPELLQHSMLKSM
jgi:serine/threonine-protein kinase TTK/MPS1